MKKYHLLFISIFVLVLMACHSKKATVKECDSNVPVSITTTEISSVIINPKVDFANMNTACRVDSLSINGDVLSVFVNYSGGCKLHLFELYTDGMYAKSLPPQVTIFLKHIDNGDACRELIMQELKFDISKLKYPNQHTVVVKLGEKNIKYITK
jgi:iron only hydrogenase large subunit-like protein